MQKPFYSTDNGKAYLGDSLHLMRELETESIDLVMTSPPFALQKKKDYGNVPPNEYVQWFLPFAFEMKRVIREHGSVVIDLGGSWVKGQPTKSLYQWKLLIALCEDVGFHLAQEFYWYNKAKLPTPAQWVTIERIRVKDAVNTLFWLSKDPRPKADNRRVLVPYSSSMLSLFDNGYNAGERPSGHVISDTFDNRNDGAIPPNFFELANTGSNTKYLRACRALGVSPHPARYPAALPEFFIKLLTEEGDTVLDPFAGSNITGNSAEELGRQWICIEIVEEYLQSSKLRFEDLEETKMLLKQVAEIEQGAS